jgi:hypothetical protein
MKNKYSLVLRLHQTLFWVNLKLEKGHDTNKGNHADAAAATVFQDGPINSAGPPIAVTGCGRAVEKGSMSGSVMPVEASLDGPL